MNLFSKKSNPDDENRLRLQKLVNQTKKIETPIIKKEKKQG